MVEITILFAVLLQAWFLFGVNATVYDKIAAILGVVAILSASYVDHFLGFRLAFILWFAVMAWQMGSTVPKGFKLLNLALFIGIGTTLMVQKGFGWG